MTSVIPSASEESFLILKITPRFKLNHYPRVRFLDIFLTLGYGFVNTFIRIWKREMFN